jgi:putative ABC transport system substrate-binding protein
MKRRTVTAGMAAVMAAPFDTDAQQPGKVYRIGSLSELPRYVPTEERLRRALGRQGYVDGQNTIFDFGWGDGSLNTLDLLAGELIRLQPDVILTGGTFAAVAARKVTTAIPIVAMSADPFIDGLVSESGTPRRKRNGRRCAVGRFGG